MRARALALLSGGLDSMLAIRVLQEQGVEVEALNFRTVFTCCQDQAHEAAEELGVRLTVLPAGDDYLDVIKSPRHGYGRGANPCVDCRSYMFRRAALALKELDCSFVISGEVLGQRPMSQKRVDLGTIAHEAGLDDRLLRPLSAKLLPPTEPEEQGTVDRSRLHAFAGTSRKGLIALAKQFGFRRIPTPSTGCALTEPQFAPKVFDLIELQPAGRRWDFELLRTGRHVRMTAATKIVLGRREEENEILEAMFRRSDANAAALLKPENFRGPVALVIGECDEAALQFAGGLLLRYGSVSEGTSPAAAVIRRDAIRGDGGSEPSQIIAIEENLAAQAALPL